MSYTKEKEQELHLRVARYIQQKYPTIKFYSDVMGSNMPFPVRRNAFALRSTDKDGTMTKFPDLFIPLMVDGYGGLFIELKREGTAILKKDGTMRKNKHLEKQAQILKYLNDEGYMAAFCVGFEEAIELIDIYLYRWKQKHSSITGEKRTN